MLNINIKTRDLKITAFEIRLLIFAIIFSIIGPAISQPLHSQENSDTVLDPESIEIITEKYTFKANIKGKRDETPVFLLHGFPETSSMWSGLQNLLAKNGYFSIAPDQRGYSPGARPKGKENYLIELLAQDVIDMADALNIKKFHLIGHDWGSAVGWYIVYHYPERIISWSAMSVPHLQAFSGAMQNNRAQKKASQYMRQFQIALFPELFMEASDFKALRKVWEYSTPEEIDAYLRVFKQKGALTASLNWYRANYKLLLKMYDPNNKPKEMITVPTLFIWGKNDPAILESSVSLNKDYIEGEYSELFLDSGHWLIQESYKEVSEAILLMLENH